MLVRMPVPYEISYREKGRRNFVTKRHVSVEDAEIPEVGADDAPLAASGFVIRPRAVSAAMPTHALWFEGSLWMPSRQDGDGAAMTARDWEAETMKAGPGGEAWRRFVRQHQGNSYSPQQAASFPQLDATALRDIEWTNLREVRDAARDLVRSEFLAVDGRVYRRAEMPLYKVSYLLGASPEIGTSEGVDWVSAGLCEYFSLTRREDLVQHMADCRYWGELPPEPDIRLPDAFEFPDEEASMALYAGHAFRVVRRDLERLDDRSGPAWFRMRAAAQNLKAALTADAPAAQEAWRDLAQEAVNAMEEWVTACGPDNEISNVRESVLAASRALTRWEMRPMEPETIMGVMR